MADEQKSAKQTRQEIEDAYHLQQWQEKNGWWEYPFLSLWTKAAEADDELYSKEEWKQMHDILLELARGSRPPLDVDIRFESVSKDTFDIKANIEAICKRLRHVEALVAKTSTDLQGSAEIMNPLQLTNNVRENLRLITVLGQQYRELHDKFGKLAQRVLDENNFPTAIAGLNGLKKRLEELVTAINADIKEVRGLAESTQANLADWAERTRKLEQNNETR